MKGRNLIFLSIVVLAAGIVLLLARNSIGSENVVTVGGVLFILAGIFNVLSFDAGRNKEKKNNNGKSSHGPVAAVMNWMSSGAALILGICMLVFRSTFVSLVPVMFGILVAFAAFYQLYLLAVGIRPVVLPAVFYIIPLLLAGAAAFLFFQEGNVTQDVIVIVTAVAMLVFGATGVAEGAMLGNENRMMRREGASTPEEAREKRAARLEAKAAAKQAPIESKQNKEIHAAESHQEEEMTSTHENEATPQMDAPKKDTGDVPTDKPTKEGAPLDE